MTSITDQKGNALKVARELRDAGAEAIKLANATNKPISLTSPLLNKASVQSWLKRNGFTPTRQNLWYKDLLIWIFFGPTIAFITLFTGNMQIGPWQTWTRK